MGRTENLNTIVGIFQANVQQENGEYAAQQTARYLSGFVALFGHRSISSLSAHDLLAYRTHLSKSYSPSTTAAYLSAAKRCVEWAAAMEYRPPISLRIVKPPQQKPTPDKAWSKDEVTKLLSMAQRHYLQAYLWGSIQYLCCLRPSEMLRLAHGQGSWAEEGVFVPAESKTTQKSGIPRHLIVCPTALALLQDVKTVWSCLQSYGDGMKTATDFTPHRYRHSSATHLSKAGASYDNVRFLLGHYDSTTFRYLRPDWQGLRGMAEALLSPQVPALVHKQLKPSRKTINLPASTQRQRQQKQPQCLDV